MPVFTTESATDRSANVTRAGKATIALVSIVKMLEIVRLTDHVLDQITANAELDGRDVVVQ